MLVIIACRRLVLQEVHVHSRWFVGVGVGLSKLLPSSTGGYRQHEVLVLVVGWKGLVVYDEVSQLGLVLKGRILGYLLQIYYSFHVRAIRINFLVLGICLVCLALVRTVGLLTLCLDRL